jgi:hypothetical protein
MTRTLFSSTLLISTALTLPWEGQAQIPQHERDIGPRTKPVIIRPAAAEQVKKKKTPPPAPAPVAQEEENPPQPTAAPPVPQPAPPRPVIVEPHVTVQSPSSEGWLGWALLALGTCFTAVFATNTWLNRPSQWRFDPRMLLNDPEFKSMVLEAAHSAPQVDERTLLRTALERIEARALPPNKRSEG